MDGVVEGSALLPGVGDRVRITVQLVDVASDRSLWAKSYERDLTDILALQSEVAHAIADEIRIQVTPDERARLRSKGAVNPAAHVASPHLQGSFLWNRFTGDSVKGGNPALRGGAGDRSQSRSRLCRARRELHHAGKSPHPPAA